MPVLASGTTRRDERGVWTRANGCAVRESGGWAARRFLALSRSAHVEVFLIRSAAASDVVDAAEQSASERASTSGFAVDTPPRTGEWRAVCGQYEAERTPKARESQRENIVATGGWGDEQNEPPRSIRAAELHLDLVRLRLAHRRLLLLLHQHSTRTRILDRRRCSRNERLRRGRQRRTRHDRSIHRPRRRHRVLELPRGDSRRANAERGGSGWRFGRDGGDGGRGSGEDGTTGDEEGFEGFELGLEVGERLGLGGGLLF